MHWFFGWLFLALHCLSPSYHLFFPAPKVKCEAAARSLLRAPFLRSQAEGRASPSPPAWWPTALTFRARCQSHLLTQAFANKGSSPYIALSFEDASSFAYFLLLPNIQHSNSWIQRIEGQSWWRNIRLLYSYPTFFPTTDSDNLKHKKCLCFCIACLIPGNSTLCFENNMYFPSFVCSESLKKGYQNNMQQWMLYRETQAGRPIRGCQHCKEVAAGEIWLDPNPHSLLCPPKQKNQADLFSPKG